MAASAYKSRDRDRLIGDLRRFGARLWQRANACIMVVEDSVASQKHTVEGLQALHRPHNFYHARNRLLILAYLTEVLATLDGGGSRCRAASPGTGDRGGTSASRSPASRQ